MSGDTAYAGKQFFPAVCLHVVLVNSDFVSEVSGTTVALA
jgi:hypothetical protein